ncbi:MAG: helix-turn-helix transcriptional regulator [Victivallaceae bacterium]
MTLLSSNPASGDAADWPGRRKCCRLCYFTGAGLENELLYCSALFDVHWLAGASYRHDRLDWLGIEYVHEGALAARAEDREYRVLPGEIFLARPGTAGELRPGPEGFAVKTSLLLHGPLLKEYLRLGGLDRVEHLSGIDRPRFELLLDRMRRLGGAPVPEVRRENGALAYRLLDFLRHFAPESAVPEPLAKVAAYLERHWNSIPSRRELAKVAGCSPTHLNRIFVRFYGEPPGRYAARLRLRRAAELLLAKPGLSIKEVAAEAGYGDALNFSTAFRRFFGRSPRQFRRSHP